MRGCGGGLGIGSIVAVLLSWSLNHSPLWALIDFFFGWLYVIYAFLTRWPEISRLLGIH